MSDSEEMGWLPYIVFCLVLTIGAYLGNEYIANPLHMDETAKALALIVWLFVVVFIFWKVNEYMKIKGRNMF